MKLDLLITGARVQTMDPARPTAHTIGVWGGRIIGLDEDVAGLPAARTLDLGGATVLPGFNDVHCHTTWFGLTLDSVDVENLPGGMDELYSKLEAEARRLPAGEWINATGFAQQDYADQYPDLEVLDRICGDHPLFLRKVSGHAAIANTLAMDKAGMLAPGFTDPEGGLVVRDSSGRPTGLVEETAQNLVQDLIRPYSQAQIEKVLGLATAEYAREGITSFGEAGICGGWIGHSPVEVSAYMRARTSGALKARAQLLPAIQTLHPITANSADDFGTGLDLGMVTGFGDDYLSIGPTKMFMDGALSGETAAMSENYAGRDTKGYLQDEFEVLRAQALAAYRSGWSLAIHAIGDLAVKGAVDIIAEAVDTYGAPGHGGAAAGGRASALNAHPVPNRIEHAAIVPDALLPRIKEYGIAVTPQSAFADNIGDSMNTVLGGADHPRTAQLYRAKAFFDAGILLPGSSDRPCANGNVLRGIQAFVDRATRSGAVMGSAAEKLSPLQAVQAYTTIAAQASGQGHLKGTLTPGKLADFVVLGADPLTVDPTTIAATEVLATFVGGVETHTTL